MKTICDEFEVYGYRRVGAELRHRGIVVNAKKIRRYDRSDWEQTCRFGLPEGLPNLQLFGPSSRPISPMNSSISPQRDLAVVRKARGLLRRYALCPCLRRLCQSHR
jgi:hypothetical protein